jgi:hypothetical protein
MPDSVPSEALSDSYAKPLPMATIRRRLMC